jgi:RES domain
LHLPRALNLANAGHARAVPFGVTAGTGAIEESYRHTTRAWAEAFHAAGFDGVRYRVSHDPSQRAIGVALFGPAGEADWPWPTPKPVDTGLISAIRRRYSLVVLPTP